MAVAQIFHESHVTLMENLDETLDTKLESLEARLDAKIATTARTRLTGWRVAGWVTTVGMMMALYGLFVRTFSCS